MIKHLRQEFIFLRGWVFFIHKTKKKVVSEQKIRAFSMALNENTLEGSKDKKALEIRLHKIHSFDMCLSLSTAHEEALVSNIMVGCISTRSQCCKAIINNLPAMILTEDLNKNFFRRLNLHVLPYLDNNSHRFNPCLASV